MQRPAADAPRAGDTGGDGRPEWPGRATAAPGWSWRRSTLLAVVLVVAASLFWIGREYGSLEELARREDALRRWGGEHPVLIYAAAFGLYVVITAVVPSAAALSLAYAWYFGFWRSVVLLSFASTSGATLAFLLSRYLFRDVLRRRHGERLQRLALALDREGAWYLFALRLTPVVPFFLVNTLMGLTRLPVRSFWLVSQLGMLPGTMVYAYAGSSAPSLRAIAEGGWQGVPVVQLAFAFTLLGCFPLIARWGVRRWRRAG